MLYFIVRLVRFLFELRKGDRVFNINKVSYVPIYEQIISEFERYVMAGLLNSDDKLPSVRALSMDLSVNPNTIQKAYAELGKASVTAYRAAEDLSRRKRPSLSGNVREGFLTKSGSWRGS